jgi:hypothetical protein
MVAPSSRFGTAKVSRRKTRVSKGVVDRQVDHLWVSCLGQRVGQFGGHLWAHPRCESRWQAHQCMLILHESYTKRMMIVRGSCARPMLKKPLSFHPLFTQFLIAQISQACTVVDFVQ